MSSPHKPLPKPSRVAKMSVRPVWKKKLNYCHTSNEVDVNLPTPMPKPQSPLKESSQENPLVTLSKHDSLQPHSLLLGDSCDTNVRQDFIPPQSVNQTKHTQPSFPHLLINPHVASVLHAQTPPSPQGDNQTQPSLPPSPILPASEIFWKEYSNALKIIKTSPKVHNSRNKPIVSQVKASNVDSLEMAKLTDAVTQVTIAVATMMKQIQAPASASVKAVKESCVTCGGAHSYRQCPATDGNTFTGYHDNIQDNVSANRGEHIIIIKDIVPRNPYFANDAVNENIQTQMTSLTNPNIELKSMFGQFMKMNTASSSGSGSLPSNTVPNPREDLKAITTRSGATLAGPLVPSPPPPSKEVDREPETKTDQVVTGSTNNVPPPVVQPSPASTSSTPISSPKITEPNPHQPPIPYPLRISCMNKEKLLEMTNTPVNENCSAMILKKLPEKLRDTSRFLIPCDFYGLETCMALADLGASINLMPLSMWKTLSLPELTPTRMTLELATWTVSYPKGIAEDVFVQVGKFTFPADFVVVDYEVDPRVPLILGRPFLRTAHALVDVHGKKLTLRVGDEELVFNIESASKHPQKHSDNSIHKIDILDTTCEEHVHEIPPGIDDDTYDSKGDILFLERLLNDDPTPDLPPIPQPVCFINDAEKIKSSIDDPPDLELKDLPSHLEYAFLEGTSKLPVIIAKDLKREEKEQLLKVLKSHKRAIAWKISNIRGIDPNFCTYKILMEDDFKPHVQHQRRETIPCFLDRFSGYFQIPIDPKTRKRPLSPVLMEHLLIDECLLVFAMLLGHSKGV
ncbi:reverse transcriptase domain-containing protein [Tanacetum coccineum]